MPIRYSPLFQQAMFPLPSSTLVHETMTQAMRVLRSQRYILLTVMEVFVREPHVDWQKGGEGGLNGTQRVHFAGMKLAGYSSSSIMAQEIQQIGGADSARLKTIVEGDRIQHYGADILSIGDQIRCLLDHASDDLILAVAYDGWRPYL
jgi:DNA-dependent protein kinase catalytic subunit